MIRVSIIGMGNVGSQLYAALRQQSAISIVQRYTRSVAQEADNQSEDWCFDLANLRSADVYILAIPDDQIATLSNELPFDGRLVVHTSGTVSMEELDSKNRRGVLYPLQTFSREREVDMREVPFCLEAEQERDLKTLWTLAESLSHTVVELPSRKRLQLHLGAVIVNNFTNHLYHVAHELLAQHAIDFNLLKPLIRETVNKLEELEPRAAQTGPARRNDLGTLKKHVALLHNDDWRQLYELMSSLIQKTYGKKL